MSPFLAPAGYALFVWWFSTGLIILLDNLPRRTFRWSMIGGSAIGATSLYRLWSGGNDTSITGVYAAFTYGLLVWGWHEMSFFMGYVTGPRRTPCPPEAVGWRRFGFGVSACLYHELAILITAALVVAATWNATNQVGLWTFMTLWGARQSAKLNVFLGVLNLNEQFVPPHLAFSGELHEVPPHEPAVPPQRHGWDSLGGLARSTGGGARHLCPGQGRPDLRSGHAGPGRGGALVPGIATAVRAPLELGVAVARHEHTGWPSRGCAPGQCGSR